MPKNAEKFGLAFWKECAAFDPSGDRISLCGQIFWMVANQKVYGQRLLYIILLDVVENKKNGEIVHSLEKKYHLRATY